jgi:hypothetical protein
MQVGYFTVEGENCFNRIKEYLQQEYRNGYSVSIPEGFLVFTENYSLMTSSDLMISIRLQQVRQSNDACEIEVVAGGGGQGIFHFRFGNEGRRVDKISNRIAKFCFSLNYKISKFAGTR